MRTQSVSLGLGLLLLAGSPAHAANADTAPSAAVAVVAAFHAALARGEADAALAQLTPDALIYESGEGQDLAAYAAHHLAADIAFARDTRRVVSNTRQQCAPTLCVLMQESETSGSYKGKPVHFRGVETSVLRLDDGHWRITHVHWSSR